MKKNKTVLDLSQEWDDAVHSAAERAQQEDSLSREMLNTAAGLGVQSGVRAGDRTWNQSANSQCQSCYGTCAYC